MTEIAAELGLSRVTVSCVLNGSAQRIGFAEKTIRRVREHLERRGYVPSRAACNLRESPGRTIGLLQTDSLYSHLVEAFNRLAGAFSGNDPALEVMMTPWERVKPAVQELLSRRVTDLVWIHNTSVMEAYRNPDIAAYLANMRTIIYNYPFDSPLGEKELLDRGIFLVGIDRLAQARRLARFLKRLGHCAIALPDARRAISPRYFEAFETAGLTVADFPPPFTVDGMVKAMKEPGVTAVCFHGDNSACLALCGLRAAGVRVPEDLTVTGFDGMSRSFNPDLTTQAIPVEKMVGKVCELVKGADKVQRHCFDLELVKGRTHGPVSRGA